MFYYRQFNVRQIYIKDHQRISWLKVVFQRQIMLDYVTKKQWLAIYSLRAWYSLYIANLINFYISYFSTNTRIFGRLTDGIYFKASMVSQTQPWQTNEIGLTHHCYRTYDLSFGTWNSRTLIRAVDMDIRYIFGGSGPDFFTRCNLNTCFQTFADLSLI